MIKSGNFSIKSYVVAIFQNCLGDSSLMDSHNIGFYGELMVITKKNPLIIWSTIKVSWVKRCSRNVLCRYAARFDCGCHYKIKIKLLDADKKVLDCFQFEDNKDPGRDWFKV